MHKALLLLLLVAPALAQERPMPLEIVRPVKNFRMSDKILFVVDSSGSMAMHLKLAMQSVLLITRTPMDGFQVGLINFAGGPVRWKGKPKCMHKKRLKHSAKCVLPGWAEMPTEHKAFEKYLQGSIISGMTRADLAVRLAMKERVQDVTIVLVTDGEFDHGHLIKEIEKGRAYRKKHKLGTVYIMIWGVGSQAKDLKDVAKVGGGGLWIHGKKRSGPW